MKRLLLSAVAAIGLIGSAGATELSPLLSTMNADNPTFYLGLNSYPNAGFGAEGKLYGITSSIATGTGTAAQTLGTYSLPGGALDVPGRKLRIVAAFTSAANTNSKTCTLNFGSEQVSTGAVTTSAQKSFLELNVLKTGTNTQTVWGNGQTGTTNIAVYSAAATETDTAAIAITAICTDGTSSAGDATLIDFFVEAIQ